MRIIKERPPIYDAICSIIGKPPATAIFAYGDTIYNPSGLSLPEDIIRHEQVHQKQQGDAVVDWWRKYLRDEEFRLDQEIEAYGVQYKFIHETNTSREFRFKALMQMAKSLASPMYGDLIDVGRARQRIFRAARV